MKNKEIIDKKGLEEMFLGLLVGMGLTFNFYFLIYSMGKEITFLFLMLLVILFITTMECKFLTYCIRSKRK